MSRTTSFESLTLLEAITRPVHRAARLLAENGIDHFENMEDLAKRLGFRTEYVTTLPLDNGGFAYFDDDGLPCIAVNTLNHPVHKEVTIGEEIGHHVLGHHRQYWRSTRKLDMEAKLFACTLLGYSKAMISNGEYRDHNPDIATMLNIVLPLSLLPEVLGFFLVLHETRAAAQTGPVGLISFVDRLARIWEFLADERVLIDSMNCRNTRKAPASGAFRELKRLLTKNLVESKMKRLKSAT